MAGLLVLMLPLAACSAGPDALGSPDDIVQPIATTNQPGSVSRKPLLPPVPEPQQQAPQSNENWSTSSPPLQYDQLYSDDEQAKIQADLLKAAARARAN